MELDEELLRRSYQVTGFLLVRPRVPSWQYAVAKTTARNANHPRRNNQDSRHVCLGDPMQPTISAEPVIRTNVGSGSYQPRPVQELRKRNAPDYRYGSNQVAAVEQDQQAAGRSQRPRYDGQKQWNSGPKQWPPRNDYPRKPWQKREKFTYDQMLDRPCSHHSQLLGKPSDHTNRQCA